MQSLEDQESQFKKEILKSFDPKLESKCLLNNSETNSSNLYYYATKIKKINFLYFCLNQSENNEINSDNFSNKTNFRSMFNTLSKLNKSINLFNGDLNKITSNIDDLSFLNNVHASMNDLNGLLSNYFEKNNNSNQNFRFQSSNVSLISNIYETCSNTDLNDKNIYSNFLRKNMKLFGTGNHSTMLFEYQNIKIGFMGLIDELVYEKLICAIKSKSGQIDLMEEKGAENPVEYIDFVTEADRLSKQLRQCGANLIVALTNMETDLNELKLLREAQDLDIVYSNRYDSTKKQVYSIDNRWMIKSISNIDSISLISLCLDELDCNKILDISISKYLVE